MSEMRAGRAARTVLHSGTASTLDLYGWNPGPLPLAISAPNRTVTADLAGRSQVLEPNAQRMTLAGPLVSRHWRWLDGRLAEAGFWAAEIVQYAPSLVGGPHRCCLVLQHSSRRDASRAQAVAELFRPAPVEAIDQLLPGFSPRKIRGRTAIYELRLLTACSEWITDVASGNALTAQDEWLWRLASGTASADEEFTRTLPEHRRINVSAAMFAAEAVPDENLLTWSSDWQALVLRDGAGFVGLDADPTGSILEWSENDLVATREAAFIDFGELYMRTIYADAFIVGDLQRWGLADIGRAIVDEPRVKMSGTLRSARQLDSDLATFRRRDWWQNIASGGPANSLLRAFQAQQDLPQILHRCSSDVEDGSRLASQAADQRLSGALAVISTIGLPIAACLAAADLLSPPDIDLGDRIIALILGLVVSAALSAVLLLVFPGLRAALQDSLLRRD